MRTIDFRHEGDQKQVPSFVVQDENERFRQYSPRTHEPVTVDEGRQLLLTTQNGSNKCVRRNPFATSNDFRIGGLECQLCGKTVVLLQRASTRGKSLPGKS